MIRREVAVPGRPSPLASSRIPTPPIHPRQNGEETAPVPAPALQPDANSATVAGQPSQSLADPGGDARRPAELYPKSNDPATTDAGKGIDHSTADRNVLAQELPDPKRQTRTPRKRLMRDGDGKLVVLDGLTANRDVVHNLEAQFDAMLGNEITSRFRALLRKNADEPAEGSECTARIRVNLETAELDVLDVGGSVNTQEKSRLCEAVKGCSGWLPIPPEIKSERGQYYTTQLAVRF